MVADVERFNREIIGLTIPDRPTLLSEARGNFRVKHLQEELIETHAAMAEGDMEGIVDGVIDLVYVALGTLVEMGVAAGVAFDEVHAANMAKKRGMTKRPGSLGYDAVKPEGWSPPNLAPYLTVTRDQILAAMALGTDPRVGSRKYKYMRDGVKPNLLVIGHARHGKDTVCEALRATFGFRFTSSSRFCAEQVVMPALARRYGYQTVEECFHDRVNHRQEWYELIRDFNRPDATALARAILRENDVYCGMRHSTELHACRNVGMFDIIIWVDASQRVGPEDGASCTVEPWMADYVLDNNGTPEDLSYNILQLVEQLI